jgi:replicative DNA helicase
MQDNTAEIEAAFMACLLNKPDFIALCADKLKPEYLANEQYGAIYATIKNNSAITVPEIAEKCKLKLTDLVDLMNTVHIVSKVSFNGYAAMVLECYKKRKMSEVRQNASDDEIGEKIEEIQRLKYFDDTKTDAVREFLHNVELIINGKKDERLVETCFYNIDRTIGGFRKSELIIIGGRPGSGKTTFALNIATKMAWQGKKVCFFSLEMAKPELLDRIVKSQTGIEKYTESQIGEIVETTREIEALPLQIFDKAGMTFEDIYFAIKQEKNVDCVFIDHLSILKSNRKYKSRYEEISDLSRRLKCLAKEFDVPVVCLCQLNRQLESRDIKAPTLADLRDSGSIEQDADLVGFVYRPEYHLRQVEPNANDPKHTLWEEKMREVAGKAKFILAKNRRGELRNFNFEFKGSIYKFLEEENYVCN